MTFDAQPVKLVLRRMDVPMRQPLNLSKITDNRYGLAFESKDGKLFCDISVARQGGLLDMRSDADKLAEVLAKAKALAHALGSAIEE